FGRRRGNCSSAICAGAAPIPLATLCGSCAKPLSAFLVESRPSCAPTMASIAKRWWGGVTPGGSPLHYGRGNRPLAGEDWRGARAVLAAAARIRLKRSGRGALPTHGLGTLLSLCRQTRARGEGERRTVLEISCGGHER